MKDLKMPLLHHQTRAQAATAPLELQVLRHNAFSLDVRSKRGDVVIRVSKRKPYNPFCGLDWQLSDEIDLTSPHIHVKAPPFSSRVTLAAAGGAQLTSVVHRSGDASGYLTWQGHAYRWESVGHMAPLLLKLTDVKSGQHMASLQGSTSMPWRKEQQRISIFAGHEDPAWLQVVIASGLAEAKWRGGENSCTAPRRSGCSR